MTTRKLDRRRSPISSDSVYDYVAYDPVKTRMSGNQKQKNQQIVSPGINQLQGFPGLIFTRSFHSTLLIIALPTSPDPLIVKTDLKYSVPLKQ